MQRLTLFIPLVLVLVLDEALDRVDGWILIAGLVAIMGRTIYQGYHAPASESDDDVFVSDGINGLTGAPLLPALDDETLANLIGLRADLLFSRRPEESDDDLSRW